MQPSKQRAAFFTIIAVVSLGYMGTIGEICAELQYISCPARYSGLIAMGVITALVAIAGLVVSLLSLHKVIELVLLGVALICNTASCGIATSFKSTSSSIVINAYELTWVAEILLIITLFNVLFADDDQQQQPVLPSAKGVDPSAAVPLNPQPVHVQVQPMPAPVQYMSEAPVQYMSEAPMPPKQQAGQQQSV